MVIIEVILDKPFDTLLKKDLDLWVLQLLTFSLAFISSQVFSKD